MSARIELSGHRFGRWLVIRYADDRRWLCRCDCGTESFVHGSSLRRGATSGCGHCQPNRDNRRTHGQRQTRLYSIWCRMKARCLNPSDAAYDRYGGRGITICDGWRDDFTAFAEWARANGYAVDLTIDRKDNDLGYSPDNCRWATYAEQNRNYSRNRPVDYQGRTVLICDLAAEHGLPADIVKNRVRRYGWPIEKALSTPVLAKGQRS